MDAAPDAYAIWLHTRSAVTSAQYPDRIDYTVAVSGLDGSTLASDHYRASCDPQDGTIRIFSISDEELARPAPVPHGVNFSFTIAISEGRGAPGVLTIPAGKSAPAADLLGEPLLSPVYAFGMRYQPNALGTSQLQTNLRVIAVVSAQAPEYRVELLDGAAIDGAPTYHLKLTPLRHPKDNRLRELWVGIEDYLPRRAIVSGNFTRAPLVNVPWTVEFSVIDGAPYIARETAARTLYMPHRRVVRDAVISFENVRESSLTVYDRPLITPNLSDDRLVEP
jgi:hypothetical protein